MALSHSDHSSFPFVRRDWQSPRRLLLAGIAFHALFSLPVDAVAEQPIIKDSSSTESVLSEPQSASKPFQTSLAIDIGDPDGHSLAEVTRLASKCNPNFETFSANHAAAHAELLKALAYPNPELEVEGGSARPLERDENGDHPRRGIYSLSLAQPIEMPGKRAARAAEARAGFAVVDAEKLEFTSTLRADVAEAYHTVQFYAALEKLWQVQSQAAEELVRLAERRVELGEASRLELVNAGIESMKAKRQLNAQKRKRLGACAALNALAGGALGKTFRLSDPLPEHLPKRTLESSRESSFKSHPKLCKLKAELEQKYASIDRARTDWWPDVKIGVNTNREYDLQSNAVTAGVEIPLWNRNRGGLEAAAAAARKTYNDIVIALNELNRDVGIAYQQYELAREQLLGYEDGLVDASREAFDLAWTQYQVGAASYLDLLAARRIVQETMEDLVEARYEAATARARLDLAAGQL